jgi:hypothetical protein
MATAQLDAKWSPGPKYDGDAIVKFDNAPKWGFCTAVKNPLNIKPPIYEEAITVRLETNVG